MLYLTIWYLITTELIKIHKLNYSLKLKFVRLLKILIETKTKNIKEVLIFIRTFDL